MSILIYLVCIYLLDLPEGNHSVVSAESQVVRDGHSQVRHLHRLVGSVVQVTLRVRGLVVDGWGNNIRLQGFHTSNRLECSRCS